VQVRVKEVERTEAGWYMAEAVVEKAWGKGNTTPGDEIILRSHMFDSCGTGYELTPGRTHTILVGRNPFVVNVSDCVLYRFGGKDPETMACSA
jgi:hypothetical protein